MTAKMIEAVKKAMRQATIFAQRASDRRSDFRTLSTRKSLREIFRSSALGTALMGAGLGLSGFGGAEQREADAGIITDASVDPQIKAFGATYAVKNGGSVGYIRGNGSIPYASGVYLGNGWVLTAGHVVTPGGDLTFGTGTNAYSDPGTIYIPSQVILHPDYSYLGNHDIALIKYPDLNLPSNVTILNSRPETVTSIWLAGYGTTGTPAGYTGQDGFIRAGTSLAAWNSSFVTNQGFSSQYYVGSAMRPITRPLDVRFAVGDSGGGAFISPNEIYGLGIAASTSPAGTSTYLLDITGGTNRAFIDSFVGIPEPNSLALLTAAGVMTLARTRFRRKKASLSLGRPNR